MIPENLWQASMATLTAVLDGPTVLRTTVNGVAAVAIKLKKKALENIILK